VDLPESRVFEEFLDVCDHARFMTVEGRPIVCRVAFTCGMPGVWPSTNGRRSDAVSSRNAW
jgi:hypothetical protein